MANTWVLEDPLSDVLLVFLLQLALTLFLTRLLGKMLSYIHEPQVIGEIIGGILLGPSVLGNIPNFKNSVFPAKSLDTFSVVANMGLIFFMFVMGLEVDPKLLKHSWKRSIPIALASILFPFGLGMLNSLWMEDVNDDGTLKSPNHTGFILFAGTSMSFTAFPVLAALLTSTRLLHTPLGVQCLSCAAVDDVLAWSLLAISSSFSKSGSADNGGYTMLLAACFLIFMFFVVRPIIGVLHKYMTDNGKENDRFFLMPLFLMLIGSAYCAEIIGIHAFLGSFVAGIIVPKQGNFVRNLIPQIELVINEVFLPLFFANSGIKTNIGSLTTGADWGYTFALIGLAIVGKMVPGVLMTRWFTGNGWKYCFAVGTLMNTRGLVELIALNVGLTLGILSVRMFTMLVIMAIVTTVMTAPILQLLKLEEKDVSAIYNGKTLAEIQLTRANSRTEVGSGNGNGNSDGPEGSSSSGSTHANGHHGSVSTAAGTSAHGHGAPNRQDSVDSNINVDDAHPAVVGIGAAAAATRVDERAVLDLDSADPSQPQPLQQQQQYAPSRNNSSIRRPTQGGDSSGGASPEQALSPQQPSPHTAPRLMFSPKTASRRAGSGKQGSTRRATSGSSLSISGTGDQDGLVNDVELGVVMGSSHQDAAYHSDITAANYERTGSFLQIASVLDQPDLFDVSDAATPAARNSVS